MVIATATINRNSEYAQCTVHLKRVFLMHSSNETHHISQGIILLVLSFMKKRVHLCPTTMRGVPGLIM